MKKTIQVFSGEKIGKIKKVNGGNLAPAIVNEKAGGSIRKEFGELHLPLTRLHDAPLENAGTRLVDVPLIFANFHADPDDPRNYYFKQTDDYLKNCIELGTSIYYRLGTSIEHGIHKYFLDPPDARQWIEIVSHIIRHYTEGWADGFRYDIRYWEIWNEPECTDRDGLHLMWNGTLEEFNDFYAVTATELKKRFPHLKFGGPAHCWFGDHSREFIRFCARHHAPLDFYSYHGYAKAPADLLRSPTEVRRTLDENGFRNTEIHLNEWHYFPLDWKMLREDKSYRETAYRIMKGLESAAFLNTVMIGWQDTPLDLGCYYTATATNWGLFDHFTMPTKSYYGMKAFGETALFDNRIRTETDADGDSISALASANENGDMRILVSCFKTGTAELEFNIAGLENFSSVELLLLDDAHNLEPVFQAGKISGPFHSATLSDSSVFLLKCTHRS